MKEINFVITDLDDTIWNWLEMWYNSFNPYLQRVAKETNVDINTLKADFKKLHQKYGTTEMSFVYKELKSIDSCFYPLFEATDLETKNILHEYNSNKKNNLKAYEGVIETLKYIKSKGTKVVAFTESNVFFTKYRIKHLRLDGIIDCIYTPEGHNLPSSVNKHYEDDFWDPKITLIKTLPPNTKKPNAEILEAILRDFKANKEYTFYIGDKLDRDIYMAQQAQITSVHASYGHVIDNDKYNLLVEVTHWTDEDVKRERDFKRRKLSIDAPDYEITTFSQLKNLFKFTNFKQYD